MFKSYLLSSRHKLFPYVSVPRYILPNVRWKQYDSNLQRARYGEEKQNLSDLLNISPPSPIPCLFTVKIAVCFIFESNIYRSHLVGWMSLCCFHTESDKQYCGLLHCNFRTYTERKVFNSVLSLPHNLEIDK